MCTVILGWNLLPQVPVVVAANRDELLARPSDPPLLLTDQPPRWGGRDRLAGGTWLTVDPAGRVGAVTNRHPGGRPPVRDTARRSRGSLPLDVLAGSDADARDWANRPDPLDFNPVNVLYASPSDAWSLSMDDSIGRLFTTLGPGVHVLTEQDVDDSRDPKTQAIWADADTVAGQVQTADDLVLGWREILRSHEARYAGSPACIHGDLHGTVSSATVVVTTRENGPPDVHYEHAEGPPCRTPYRAVI